MKILDFGMAKLREGEGLTRAGDLVGTPLYMAPERAVPGYRADGRSDLYSLGVVLYRLCTGAYPFTGETTEALFRSVAKDRPVPVAVRNPEVPPVLSDLIDRMLRKAPPGPPGRRAGGR